MRGNPDRRGVVGRGEGAQAHRRDPGEESQKVCEKKLLGTIAAGWVVPVSPTPQNSHTLLLGVSKSAAI